MITSPYDDAGGTDAGAVYLFNGRTGQLISTLKGSHPDDNIGSSHGVVALPNGNFVVVSYLWDNGVVRNAGAVTFGSGISGVSGVVSNANSLVGTTINDAVGSGGITVLSNGNYVVSSPGWTNGPMLLKKVGAVTFGSGVTGVTGDLTAGNSLIGSAQDDMVSFIPGGWSGYRAVTPLAGGGYVVSSPYWNGGWGAVTLANGATGLIGTVSSANSLVGGNSDDMVGRVKALSNGNYVVVSPDWAANSVFSEKWGAVTFVDPSIQKVGQIGPWNSLVGSHDFDQIGAGGVTELENGNYVVPSSWWNQGRGAATFGNGLSGVNGEVGSTNSLVGSSPGNAVGGSVTALANGNYVVVSSGWDNDSTQTQDVGAVTFANGVQGMVGTVRADNSLIGSIEDDQVGLCGVTPLANGNYVVCSSKWDNGATKDVGAITFARGPTGISGEVSVSNSLIGGSAGDQVGYGQVVALDTGNYVVGSELWDRPGVRVPDVGAVTFGSGRTGVTGVVSASNSLVGSSEDDRIGIGGVVKLSGGSYVVPSRNWDNTFTDTVDAGAVTWGDGVTGVSGAVSSTNSLVGSTKSDFVGEGGVVPLANGNFVFRNSNWHGSGMTSVGAVTFGGVTSGRSGIVSSANSLVGNTEGDFQFASVIPFANGNYVVTGYSWDNNTLVDAGAVVFGDGISGTGSSVTVSNGIVGGTANSGLLSLVLDEFNRTFYARFVFDGGDRLRVGSQIDGFSHRWHFAAKPLDVNNDLSVAPADALAIINYINGGFATVVAADAEVGKPFGFLDVTGDDNVAPADALAIINAINAGQGREGEGESVRTGAEEQSEEGGLRNAESTQRGGSLTVTDIEDLIAMLAADFFDRTGRRKAG